LTAQQQVLARPVLLERPLAIPQPRLARSRRLTPRHLRQPRRLLNAPPDTAGRSAFGYAPANLQSGQLTCRRLLNAPGGDRPAPLALGVWPSTLARLWRFGNPRRTLRHITQEIRLVARDKLTAAATL